MSDHLQIPNKIKDILLSEELTADTRYLTCSDKAAAVALKSLWVEFKNRTGLTQEDAAEKLGWSQGNFNQYINGKVPVGGKALNLFCELFNCAPSKIRRELCGNDLIESLNEANVLLTNTLNEIDNTKYPQFNELCMSIKSFTERLS